MELTKLFGFVRQYNYSRVALWTDIFLDFKMGISLKIRSYLSFCLFSVSYQFRNRSTSIQDKIPDPLSTWGASIQVPGRSTRTLTRTLPAGPVDITVYFDYLTFRGRIDTLLPAEKTQKQRTATISRSPLIIMEDECTATPLKT